MATSELVAKHLLKERSRRNRRFRRAYRGGCCLRCPEARTILPFIHSCSQHGPLSVRAGLACAVTWAIASTAHSKMDLDAVFGGDKPCWNFLHVIVTVEWSGVLAPMLRLRRSFFCSQ